MKIKGKEYSLLTSNRGWAQFGVLKRRTNFDLNCGGVYGGISSVRRDLFDYRGYRELVQLLLNYQSLRSFFGDLIMRVTRSGMHNDRQIVLPEVSTLRSCECRQLSHIIVS